MKFIPETKKTEEKKITGIVTGPRKTEDTNSQKPINYSRLVYSTSKSYSYRNIDIWPRWCSGNTRACGALVPGSNPGRGPRIDKKLLYREGET